MIHFSLKPVQANLIMRALIHVDCCTKAQAAWGREDLGLISEISQCVAAAEAVSDLRLAESASTNLEEIETKEGITLCPKIS